MYTYTILVHIHSPPHLSRNWITLSITVARCSLQERDWKSSIHSREETEWGSNLWMIIGDVAIPKMSTRGNSCMCWLDHKVGKEKENITVMWVSPALYETQPQGNTVYSQYSTTTKKTNQTVPWGPDLQEYACKTSAFSVTVQEKFPFASFT